MYGDFFDAPERPADMPAKGKKDDTKKKRSKKSKVSFAEEAEEAEEPEDAERDIMERLKADLFDNSDDEEGGPECE
jgi:U3 small nucleolar ribonucleoprotein component